MFFKIIFSLIFLSSCSLGVVSTGGKRTFSYRPQENYSLEKLKNMSSDLVVTSRRDPHEAPLSKLFTPGFMPLKRVGIVVFETEIQPTRDGLTGKNLIYLSNAGKQILTENFLKIWEESFDLISSGVDFVPTKKIKKTPSFSLYGSFEDDFIKSKRSLVDPDDVFYLESGKNNSSVALMNPRGMRDLSLILIPASELMGGPKWSEHGKHFINDVAKELNLDAVLSIISYVSWTGAHRDKHSGEFIPEEMKINIRASTLIPLNQYQKRLKILNDNRSPSVTICLGKYESEVRLPINISSEDVKKNFDTISIELITPMMKTYKDFSQMMISRIEEDLKKTW
jgi:hypothetical protein